MKTRVDDRLQSLEDWFQRFEGMMVTLIECFDTLEVGNCPHHCQPNHRTIEEEVVLEEDSTANPFVAYQPKGRRRGRGAMANNHDSRRWESGMKTEILELKGYLQPKEFLNFS